MSDFDLTKILSTIQNGVTAANNLGQILNQATIGSSSLQVTINSTIFLTSSSITGFSTSTGTVTTINTSVGLTGGPITTTGTLAVSLTTLTNTASSDLTLTTTGYVDGPSVAQGTSGKWWAEGQVTVRDNAGVAVMAAKLWDGTTVINSAAVSIPAAGEIMVMSLAGVFTNPAGNIRISAIDQTSSRGLISFNQSGNSKDSTITVMRIG